MKAVQDRVLAMEKQVQEIEEQERASKSELQGKVQDGAAAMAKLQPGDGAGHGSGGGDSAGPDREAGPRDTAACDMGRDGTEGDKRVVSRWDAGNGRLGSEKFNAGLSVTAVTP